MTRFCQQSIFRLPHGVCLYCQTYCNCCLHTPTAVLLSTMVSIVLFAPVYLLVAFQLPCQALRFIAKDCSKIAVVIAL